MGKPDKKVTKLGLLIRDRLPLLAPMLAALAACNTPSGDAVVSKNRSALTLPALPDRLGPGESLGSDGYITSQNGLYTFQCQSDGNMVVYRNRSGAPFWEPIFITGTHGTPRECDMQGSDGNFVAYGTNGGVIWTTHTNSAANAGSTMVMQNDGNLVIYDSRGTPIWASNTVQPPDRTAGTYSGSGFSTGAVAKTPTRTVPVPRVGAVLGRPSGITRNSFHNFFITAAERHTVFRVSHDNVYDFSPPGNTGQDLIDGGGAENGPNVTWPSQGVDAGYPTVQPPEVCTGCTIPYEGNYYWALKKGSLTNTISLNLWKSSIDQGAVTFTFSAYVRTQVAAANFGPDMARVKLEYLDASSNSFNPPAVVDSGVLPNTQVWTRFYNVKKVPVGARSVRITLSAVDPTPFDNTAFFDAVSLVALPTGSANVPLHGPHGLVNMESAAGESVIVANTFNHTVVKVTQFSADGSFESRLVAGVSETPGAGTTMLNTPMAVALSPAGDLYIADYGNHRIMRIASGATTMSVFAGTGTSGY